MMEKFSEMKYVRPDGEAYIQTIQKETKNLTRLQILKTRIRHLSQS